MGFFERRRVRKRVRHLLHEARHARHLREDAASAKALERLAAAEQALRRAWERREAGAVDAAAEELAAATAALFPARDRPRVREHLEILVVAVAVAMGVRTFFLQPFKIPTGSMQPTLYGIHHTPLLRPALSDRFPLSLVRLTLFGQRFVTLRAQATGRVADIRDAGNALVLRVGGADHVIPEGMALHVGPGAFVARGDVLATARRTLGDHLFVDKVRYNFSRPRRGDIFVFDITHISHPQIQPHSFYIKRLAGLPGESLGLQPPYLLADGRPLTGADGLARLLSGLPGYHGYQFPREGTAPRPLLATARDRIGLADDEFLPLGDNTHFSLDGRYFGPVKNRDVVGPACFVYWPLSRRWGPVR